MSIENLFITFSLCRRREMRRADPVDGSFDAGVAALFSAKLAHHRPVLTSPADHLVSGVAEIAALLRSPLSRKRPV